MEKLVLGLAGDVMFGRLVSEHLDAYPPGYLFGTVRPLLQQTDLNIANLETTLTNCKEKTPKVFNFRAKPEQVRVLKEGRIDAVNLANNHILDYTEQGLYDTLDTLDRAQIPHVGAGRNLEEAKEGLILKHKGIKVGLLGYTDNEPTWLAGKNKPGTAYLKVGDLDFCKEAILQLRERVDILVVSLHWGPNMRTRPPDHFVHFAHALVDLGVDIIHGHSAHIFQGVEVYQNALILYDTGDFVDDYYVDPILRNDQSFFFQVEVDKEGVVALTLTPVWIENFQVNVAEEDAGSCKRMQALSREFGTEFTRTEAGLELLIIK